MPSAENDVALIREAADLIERERGAHPFHSAVADWLTEAADHLEARGDADAFPPGSVCPTALEGLECSMLQQAVTVARAYVTPPECAYPGCARTDTTFFKYAGLNSWFCGLHGAMIP
jgi:hypothetical protein